MCEYMDVVLDGGVDTSNNMDTSQTATNSTEIDCALNDVPDTGAENTSDQSSLVLGQKIQNLKADICKLISPASSSSSSSSTTSLELTFTTSLLGQTIESVTEENLKQDLLVKVFCLPHLEFSRDLFKMVMSQQHDQEQV